MARRQTPWASPSDAIRRASSRNTCEGTAPPHSGGIWAESPRVPAFIRESLERERDLNLERLEDGQRIFKAIGDSAPAFGMIGTLVGLVQMLANLADPATIGPAMAIALLTTLYGALVANLIALPIADKLALKSKVEEVNQTLVLDGIMQIRDSKSPALIREMLIAYLPEKHRGELTEAPAAA